MRIPDDPPVAAQLSPEAIVAGYALPATAAGRYVSSYPWPWPYETEGAVGFYLLLVTCFSCGVSGCPAGVFVYVFTVARLAGGIDCVDCLCVRVDLQNVRNLLWKTGCRHW